MTVIVASQDIGFGRKLGQGAFGEVYEATLRPFGGVAVKVVMPTLTLPNSFAQWRDYLLGEADKLHAAEHPNVVRFLACSYDSSADRVFIATELCRGSVADEAGTDPVPLEVLHGYVRGALLGLECLHGRGMIHRDLKPGNILIDKQGTAKLGDFGLVSDRLLAGYGSGVGYCFHLAPEVLVNGTTSTKTDVWAMGMTVYRLLNGEAWWLEHLARQGIAPGDAVAIKTNVLKGKMARRISWMPHVPKRWRRFVCSALRDDSAQRFQDATSMLNAMSGLPVSPSWLCSITPTNIRWQRDAHRRNVVEWEGRSSNQHRVRKWSEPLPGAGGRARSFGESNTAVFEEARRQCERFLGTRTT
jgi:serine/threonine-protein kinase